MADISASMEPPSFSIPRIIATVKEKGVFKAMDDEEMGPHVHLLFLLMMVTFIAIVIAGIVLVAF